MTLGIVIIIFVIWFLSQRHNEQADKRAAHITQVMQSQPTSFQNLEHDNRMEDQQHEYNRRQRTGRP